MATSALVMATLIVAAAWLRTNMSMAVSTIAIVPTRADVDRNPRARCTVIGIISRAIDRCALVIRRCVGRLWVNRSLIGRLVIPVLLHWLLIGRGIAIIRARLLVISTLLATLVVASLRIIGSAAAVSSVVRMAAIVIASDSCASNAAYDRAED